MAPERRPRRKRPPRVAEPAAAPSANTIPASQFKARCLELMDRVNARGEEIVITKYGKPVAKLVPVRRTPPKLFGAMRGTVLEYGDVITPVEEEWDAARGG